MECDLCRAPASWLAESFVVDSHSVTLALSLFRVCCLLPFLFLLSPSLSLSLALCPPLSLSLSLSLLLLRQGIGGGLSPPATRAPHVGQERQGRTLPLRARTRTRESWRGFGTPPGVFSPGVARLYTVCFPTLSLSLSLSLRPLPLDQLNAEEAKATVTV